ncbi:hypothetical protein FXO37_14993 [Capsicum annuum]|nr:hypothetical protein FXO37_14993 [Capsicum annuum]
MLVINNVGGDNCDGWYYSDCYDGGDCCDVKVLDRYVLSMVVVMVVGGDGWWLRMVTVAEVTFFVLSRGSVGNSLYLNSEVEELRYGLRTLYPPQTLLFGNALAYFLGMHWRAAETELLTRYPYGGIILRPGFIYGTRRVGSMKLPLGVVGSPLAMILQRAKPLSQIPIVGPLFTPPVNVSAVAKVAVRAATDPVFPPGVIDVHAKDAVPDTYSSPLFNFDCCSVVFSHSVRNGYAQGIRKNQFLLFLSCLHNLISSRAAWFSSSTCAGEEG